MGESEIQILDKQRLWFKIGSFVMGFYVVILSFIFLEVWETNKRQSNKISNLESITAVLARDGVSIESRVDKIENIVYRGGKH